MNADRAKQLVEAWARGMLQGGHEVTPADYEAVYRVALQAQP